MSQPNTMSKSGISLKSALGTALAGLALAAGLAAAPLALLGAAPAVAEDMKSAPAAQTSDAKAPDAKMPGPQAAGNATDASHSTEEANGNEPATPPMLDWSFTGVFGTYDLAQLQRGYQVYKQVCSNCHSMKLVAFRNLEDLGYTEEQVKALAASYQIDDGPNDKGEMYKRPGRLSDYFPSPFPNPEAAAAAYGKAPPDMSTLAKARAWERGFPAFIFDFFTQSEEAEGPDHIHAVLNGYTKADDPKYNIYMPNHKIAMPKPLSDGQIEYTDGAPQTLEQYSKDVSAFLMWAAEPKLPQRKQTGFRVMIFLVVLAVFLYLIKKSIWARVHEGEH